MSRIESDFLGEREIPDDCYYGVQTLRGEDNFHIILHHCLRLCEKSSCDG